MFEAFEGSRLDLYFVDFAFGVKYFEFSILFYCTLFIIFVMKGVKVCFVKGCLNNSEGSPEKVFITVPLDESRRRAWFEAARQQYVSKSTRFCCEDHFNVSSLSFILQLILYLL